MKKTAAQPVAASVPAAPRLLIIGKSGQLGRELERVFTGFGSIVSAGRDSVDLADAEQTRALVRSVAPDVILNAAAYTAVDRAEFEHDLALAVNAQAPRILAEESRKRNALFVHYSTDYVFDGKKPEPWTESDETYPLNVYGASKLAGERAIHEVGGNYLIFRTSWVYGPHGKNFLRTMLRVAKERDNLAIVSDQIGAPTAAIELARATHAIVSGALAGSFGALQDWSGLYHMTCSGSTSWFGFAEAIFARAGELLDVKSPQLTAITTKDYSTDATRPLNSVLSNAKLQAQFGVRLATWQSALEEALRSLKAEVGS